MAPRNKKSNTDRIERLEERMDLFDRRLHWGMVSCHDLIIGVGAVGGGVGDYFLGIWLCPSRGWVPIIVGLAGIIISIFVAAGVDMAILTCWNHFRPV